jgi:hypothetical protein
MMGFVRKSLHVLLMAAGCVAILVAVLTLTSSISGGSWGFYLLLLLCPAMHFLMYRGMHSRGNREGIPSTQLPIPEKDASIKGQQRLSAKR